MNGDAPNTWPLDGPGTAGGAILRLPRELAVFAILLVSLGTVGSAWSVFQASRWNHRQTDRVAAATAARIDAATATTIATATLVYDTKLLAQSAAAVVDGQPTLQRVYRETLYRPALSELVDQAVARAGGDPSALPNLFTSETYLDDLLREPRRLEAVGAQAAAAGDRAGAHADAYVLVTVALALASFLAGTAANFRWMLLRMGLLAIALSALVAGATRLATLPVA